MTKISVCGECKGSGKIVIRNAWNPEAAEEVICDFCEGEGTPFEDDFDDLFKNKRNEFVEF